MYGDLRAWKREISDEVRGLTSAASCAPAGPAPWQSHETSATSSPSTPAAPPGLAAEGSGCSDSARESDGETPAQSGRAPSAHEPAAGNSAGHGAAAGGAAVRGAAAAKREPNGADEPGRAADAIAAALKGDEACLDVTLALQFQAHQGALELKASTHKRKLLGFADLYPDGPQSLYVLYRHGDKYSELEGALAQPSHV
jgi:Domain of unknown function (DUF3395)